MIQDFAALQTHISGHLGSLVRIQFVKEIAKLGISRSAGGLVEILEDLAREIVLRHSVWADLLVARLLWNVAVVAGENGLDRDFRVVIEVDVAVSTNRSLVERNTNENEGTYYTVLV
jgi:hypothetical protein